MENLASLPVLRSYNGRISMLAFQVLTGIFYAFAIIGAATRLTLQIRIHRWLRLDDYLLVNACICLTISTVLGYVYINTLFLGEELNVDSAELSKLVQGGANITDLSNTYRMLSWTYTVLLWSAIFSIKFAYLVFFRQLVDRVKPLVTYWRGIVGVTILAFSFCIISCFLPCTEQGVDTVTCFDLYHMKVALIMGVTGVILDIGTDILIITLPFCLLWKVRIRQRQKVVLGLFLCLNIFMAITACVRVSGLDINNTFDEIWLFLWQQIEACVAVSMISLTAFRSVFVTSSNSRARREAGKMPWYSSTLELVRSRKKNLSQNSEADPGLPAIPSATLTGMRTFIHGGGRTNDMSTRLRSDSVDKGDSIGWPPHQTDVAIRVSHEMRQDVETQMSSDGRELEKMNNHSFV